MWATVADPEIKGRGIPTTRPCHLANCAHVHKMYMRSSGKANNEQRGAGSPGPPPGSTTGPGPVIRNGENAMLAIFL